MTAPDEPCVCGTEFGHDCLAGEHVNRRLAWAAEAVREVHQRDATEPYACDWCGQAWPCDAIRAWTA